MKILEKFKSLFDAELALDEESTEEKIHLATATLLIEIAYADTNVDESEKKKLLLLLKERFEIPEEKLNTLVALAEKRLEEHISVYEFTRLINENYDKEQKFQLVKGMWEIAYADGDLDMYEDQMIRKLSGLLYVSHSQMLRAKHLATSE